MTRQDINKTGRRSYPMRGVAMPTIPEGDFENPRLVNEYQDTFKDREVGLTHPDTDSYVRLTDSGDIEITAMPGLGIVLHRQSNSITFMCDHVNFKTKGQDGMRWNDLSFNPRATNYTEPAFVRSDAESITSIYDDMDRYTNGY